ncbi:hypothetical protein HYU93_05015 [Candidatus Daviesbacteria bacterium]|nr:hypothetical protein [Candidatus Daviesbacteria bacterium]
MTDQGSEILKQAFGSEHAPLTEEQRQTARQACAFALVAFSSQWEGEWLNDWLQQRNVALTPEQINFARNLREVFPEASEVLPESEFDSAYNGYRSLASTPIGEIIPGLLRDANKTHPNTPYEIATDLMREDPTGVSYLQRLLADLEEKSTINSSALWGRENEVRARIIDILKKAEEVPNEPKPQKPLDDQDTSDTILYAFMATFGGNKTQRDEFVEKSRDALREEAPLEFNKEGKLLSTDALFATGARLAFERWQTAVNVYMNRWGTQTPNIQP